MEAESYSETLIPFYSYYAVWSHIPDDDNIRSCFLFSVLHAVQKYMSASWPRYVCPSLSFEAVHFTLHGDCLHNLSSDGLEGLETACLTDSRCHVHKSPPFDSMPQVVTLIVVFGRTSYRISQGYLQP